MRSTKRWALLALVVLSSLALINCGDDDDDDSDSDQTSTDVGTVGPSATQADAGWEQVVAAAEDEGELHITTSVGPEWAQVLSEFTEAYPGIEVTNLDDQQINDYAPRIISEQQNGIFDWDVVATFASNQVNVLGPAGAFQDITPFFVLPEVVDDSAWGGGFEIYGQDVTGETLSFIFTAFEAHAYLVNRDCVSEEEFSGEDPNELLDPEWRGKIVIDDLSTPRGGSLAMTILLKEMGEDWVRRLLTEQDVVVSTNAPLMQQWLITCERPIGIGVSIPAELKEQGLAQNIDDTIGPERIAQSAVSVYRNAPHPNATKVFINWFLGPEGQQAFVDAFGPLNQGITRRLDVESTSPEYAPDWDRYAEYISPNTQKDAQLIRDVIAIYQSLQ